MKGTRSILAGSVAAVALVVLGACALERNPTIATAESPEAQQPLGLQGLSAVSLFSCPNDGFGSVTQTVGRDGGVIVIGPHSLVVPRNALAEPTAITATAPAGQHVRVDFAPAGLRFQTPTALTLSFRDCPTWPLLPQIAYVDGSDLINSLLQPAKSLLEGTVTGKLEHFSGYVLAEGRR